MRGLLLSAFVILAGSFCGVAGLGGAMQGMEDSMAIQREQLERFHDFLGPQPQSDTVPPNHKKRESTITFSNPAAKKFLVDGRKIPEGYYFSLDVALCITTY